MQPKVQIGICIDSTGGVGLGNGIEQQHLFTPCVVVF